MDLSFKSSRLSLGRILPNNYFGFTSGLQSLPGRNRVHGSTRSVDESSLQPLRFSGQGQRAGPWAGTSTWPKGTGILSESLS